jgi:hypothetical protein
MPRCRQLSRAARHAASDPLDLGKVTVNLDLVAAVAFDGEEVVHAPLPLAVIDGSALISALVNARSSQATTLRLERHGERFFEREVTMTRHSPEA